MRSLARTSLGLLGLALIAPSGVRAQDSSSPMPSGYQAVAPSSSAAPSMSAMPAPVGLDGRPIIAAAAAPAAEAPHKHKGRTICAKCAAKLQAANAMPPGRIVGCEHSKNGVCSACAAALNMPGQFVVAGGQPSPVDAPGRALASSGSSPVGYAARTGRTSVATGYDAGMNEPAPVGVVQATYSQGGPMGTPAGYAPQAMAPASGSAPGRALAESTAGQDPYQAKSGPFPRPHILGHLFGWSGIGAEKAEERAWKKAEAHAMITYDENGNAPVNELPASVVFGKKGR